MPPPGVSVVCRGSFSDFVSTRTVDKANRDNAFPSTQETGLSSILSNKLVSVSSWHLDFIMDGFATLVGSLNSECNTRREVVTQIRGVVLYADGTVFRSTCRGWTVM